MKRARMKTAMQAYLDYNASAPLLEESRQAMLSAMEQTGNPSSIHRSGRATRRIIEDARHILAEVADISPKQVIFTSGATESAQQALGPRIRFGSSSIELSHLYVSSIEHPCVLAGGRFSSDQVTKLAVQSNGCIDSGQLEKMLQLHDHSNGRPLVATMLANNETGVVQPVQDIGGIIAENKAFLCVDAVQAFGKIPLDFHSFGAHFILLSAHKIGGPKGVGALLVMDEKILPDPLIQGGRQENMHRAGTENVPAIAGFGEAVKIAIGRVNNNIGAVRQLRDNIETGLEDISRNSNSGVPLPVFFGESQSRLDNTSCFAVKDIKAQIALITLDLKNISVSSGSACTSGRINQSHVLSAMGVNSDLAECALRLSIGYETTDLEVRYFLDTWREIVREKSDPVKNGEKSWSPSEKP